MTEDDAELPEEHDAIRGHSPSLEIEGSSVAIRLLEWLVQLRNSEDCFQALNRTAPPAGLRVFGRFRLECLLGSGTYGAVFRAFDTDLERLVALKVAWPAVLVDAEASRRFLEEPKTVAKLDHPGIVRVYDSNNVDVARYIEFELIEGPTLAEWLASQTLVPVRTAATIIRDVAEAVQFAHDREVIHRDLKPSNILLRPAAHFPNGFTFEPVVTDFGLARRGRNVDVSDATATHAILGTDRYMSPEQASGRSRNARRHSDIFSLGVMLYELAVGIRPFDGENGEQIRGQIQNDDPPTMRGHRNVSRDLETIILKCLEKVPELRYESAGELAEDLRRFLAGEPIRARRTSTFHRVWKFVRRHPLGVSLSSVAMIGCLVVSAFAGALIEERRSAALLVAAQRDRARIAEQEYRQRQYVAAISRAGAALSRTDMEELGRQLDDSAALRSEPLRPGIEWKYLRAAYAPENISWAAHSGGEVTGVRFLPGNEQIVSAGIDGQVRVWDAHDGTEIRQLDSGMREIGCLEVSPDGMLVGIGGDDGRVIVYQLPRFENLREVQAIESSVLCLSWVGDSRQLAAGGENGELAIIDLPEGAVRQAIVTTKLQPEDKAGRPLKVRAMQYIASRGLLALTTPGIGIAIVDPTTLERVGTWMDGVYIGRAMTSLEAVPEHLCVAESDHALRTVRVETGKLISRYFLGFQPRVARYHPGSQTLFLGGEEGAIEAWHVLRHGTMSLNGRRVIADSQTVWSMDMSSNGARLALGSENGRIAVTNAHYLRDVFDNEVAVRLWSVDFSPCGRWMAIVNTDRAGFGRVCLTDLRSGRQCWEWRDAAVAPVDENTVHGPTLQRLQNDYDPPLLPFVNVSFNGSLPEPRIAFSSDGEEIAFAIDGGAMVSLDTSSGAVGCEYPYASELNIDRLQYTPNDEQLIVYDASRAVTIFDTRTGQVIGNRKAKRRLLGVYRAGKQTWELNSAGDGAIEIRDYDSRGLVTKLQGATEWITRAKLSQDQSKVAAVGDGLNVYVWDIDQPAIPEVFFGNRDSIFDLEFSPDQQTLLTAANDGTVRFWHLATGSELLAVGNNDEKIVCFALHPSGALLALGSTRRGDTEFSCRYGLRFHHLDSHDLKLATEDGTEAELSGVGPERYPPGRTNRF